MKRNIKGLCTVVVATAFATAALGACKKNTDIDEITRGYETPTFSEAATTTQAQTTTEATTEAATEAATKESVTAEDITIHTTAETTTEVQYEGIEAYFLDKESRFYGLPTQNYGSLVEHSMRKYYETLKFSGVSAIEFESYVSSVLALNDYELDSKSEFREYIKASNGDKVSLIYFEGMMLVEVGSQWDTESYYIEPTTAETTTAHVETTTAQPEPESVKDGRYDYFENSDLLISKLPVFTEGSFSGYAATDDNVGTITFNGVTRSAYNDYAGELILGGFNSAGEGMDGTSYFEGSSIMVAVKLEGDVLTVNTVSYSRY